MRKQLFSGQKWFLRPYFPLIRGMFLLRSGLRFSFRALEVPELRVRKRPLSLLIWPFPHSRFGHKLIYQTIPKLGYISLFHHQIRKNQCKTERAQMILFVRKNNNSIDNVVCWGLVYDKLSDVAEIWVQWRSNFQSGSRVLKRVFWTFSYLYLWHSYLIFVNFSTSPHYWGL